MHLIDSAGDELWDLAFSPDGRSLAVTSSGNGLAVYEPPDPEPRRILGGTDSRPTTAPAFSPDGKWLAVAAQPRRISPRRDPNHHLQLWPIPGWEMSDHTLAPRAAGNGPRWVRFTPDSRSVIVPTETSTLRVTVPEGAVECRSAHADCRPSASPQSMTADGNYLYLIRYRNAKHARIIRKRLADGRESSVLTLKRAEGKVSGWAAQPDGSVLAGVIRGGSLHLWDAADGRDLPSPKPRPQSHVTSLTFSPDGRHLAVAENRGVIHLYDCRTWEGAAAHEWPIGRSPKLAFAPDGLRLAALGSAGRLVIWDVG